MPHSSTYADVEIPDVDLWTLLFEREYKPFRDSKRASPILPSSHPPILTSFPPSINCAAAYIPS